MAALSPTCFVIARRFNTGVQLGWAIYCRLTGLLFAAAFVGIASGSQQGGAICASVILVFTAAVVLGWTWISAMQLHLATGVRV